MIFAPSGGGGGVNPWITASIYGVGDIVYYDRVLYICETANTAAATFQADFAAGKWRPLSVNTVNYISDAEGVQVGKWVAYADAAGTAPVDGTGGSPTSISVSSTTTTPLRGNRSLLLTKGGSTTAQGEGISCDFTIDKADKAKVLQISFDYFVFSGASTYTDDELSVWVYDVTNAVVIQAAPYLIKNHTTDGEKWFGEFQTSSSSTSYRLIIHCRGTSTTNYQLSLDNIQVARQAKLYGSPVTDWVSYTPTLTGFGTATTVQFESRRVGDSLEIKGRFTSGTSTATEARISLGFNGVSGNVTSDATKVVSIQIAGHATFSAASASIPEVLIEGGVTYLTLGIQAAGSGGITKQNGNALVSSGNSIYIYAKLPILGWSSSTIMSSDAATNVVAGLFTTTTGTAFTTAATVPLAVTSIDTVGGWDGSNTYTVKIPGQYRIDANLFGVANNTTAQGITLNLRINGVNQALTYLPGVGVSQTFTPNFSKIVTLAAGDTIAIQCSSDATFTLNTTSGRSYLAIERISGPAQIAASETVSALYTGAPPTGTLNSSFNTTTFGTKVKDTHGAYSSGSYTVPISGNYDISAMVDISLASITVNSIASLAIFIDGVQTYRGITVCSSASVLEYFPQINVRSIPLLAGQIVTIRSQTTGTTPTFASNAQTNVFSIVRSGNY